MLRKLLITGALLVALLSAPAGTALADVTQVNATFTSATLIDPAHALVEGTVTCDAPASGSMFVLLRQRGGLFFGFRQAGATVGVSCGPTPTPFSLLVTGGPLHRGPAFVEASLSVSDQFGQFAQNTILTTVTIR
jgi:hypothetical protein